MIERHYFRNTLVKSFDFKFGFCIPGSTNTWDAVYSVPPLDESLIQEMVIIVSLYAYFVSITPPCLTDRKSLRNQQRLLLFC